MTTDDIKTKLAERAEDVVRHLLPGAKRQGREMVVGDLSGTPGDSLKICIEGARAGVGKDFASGPGFDNFLELWRQCRQIDFSTACREAERWLGVAPTYHGLTSPLAAIKRPTAGAQDAQKPLLQLPAMRSGTRKDHEALATLRGVSADAVACLDVNARNVRFGIWKGQSAWIVTDGKRNAQARRMDGKVWEGIGAKAQTLPGSRATWPIGLEQAEHHPIIALVEGAPDMLAAAHFALLAQRGDCWPVCVLGASVDIDADALSVFQGKRVRIFPHTDLAGAQAARRWAKRLVGIAASVDAFSFEGLRKDDGSAISDLNDCCRIHPEDQDQLKGLFPDEQDI